MTLWAIISYISDEFLKTLEEDARERGERRKEREMKGCEHKKNGNMSFRAGQYDNAIQEFTLGLEHTPWDISLYTNRALVMINACMILYNVVDVYI